MTVEVSLPVIIESVRSMCALFLRIPFGGSFFEILSDFFLEVVSKDSL